MSSELPKQYDPGSIEQQIFQQWLEDKAFAAFPPRNGS